MLHNCLIILSPYCNKTGWIVLSAFTLILQISSLVSILASWYTEFLSVWTGWEETYQDYCQTCYILLPWIKSERQYDPENPGALGQNSTACSVVSLKLCFWSRDRFFEYKLAFLWLSWTSYPVDVCLTLFSGKSSLLRLKIILNISIF